jgi:hypothetical protein
VRRRPDVIIRIWLADIILREVALFALLGCVVLSERRLHQHADLFAVAADDTDCQ